MKKFSIILIVLAFALTGCAGMQINWNVDKKALAEVAACEIGYQMAKYMPDEAGIALDYARTVMTSIEPGDAKLNLNNWKEYVLDKIGADPHYARQLSKLLPEIELPETATPEWVETVKPYVQEFIYGVEEGLPITSFIERYAKIYKANYLKFLWARSLP